MRTIVVVALLMGFMPSSSFAQSEREELEMELQSLRERVQELSAQLLQLSTENEKLKFEVESLRQRACLSKPQDEATTPGADPRPEPAADKRPSAKRAAVTNVSDLFIGFPPTAMPKGKEGWNRFTYPRAEEWVKSSLPGTEIDMTLTLATKPEITAPSGESISAKWRIVFTFERAQGLLGTTPMNMTIRTGTFDRMVSIQADEATAKRADFLKRGQRLRVTGTIAKAEFFTATYSSGTEGRIAVQLDRVQVHGWSTSP